MKSRNVKITALILCAVLITACFASSTLAYYKSETTQQSDSARVAHWNFNGISVNTFSLFSKTYSGNDQYATSSAVKVVAPGTHGNVTIKLDGAPETADKAPEVDYAYGWVVEIDLGSSAIADKIKFGTSATNINSTATEFANCYKETTLKEAGAGTLPSDISSLNIYWEWKTDVTSSACADTTNYDDSCTVTVTVKFVAKQIPKAAESAGNGNIPF